MGRTALVILGLISLSYCSSWEWRQPSNLQRQERSPPLERRHSRRITPTGDNVSRNKEAVGARNQDIILGLRSHSRGAGGQQNWKARNSKLSTDIGSVSQGFGKKRERTGPVSKRDWHFGTYPPRRNLPSPLGRTSQRDWVPIGVTAPVSRGAEFVYWNSPPEVKAAARRRNAVRNTRGDVNSVENSNSGNKVLNVASLDEEPQQLLRQGKQEDGPVTDEDDVQEGFVIDSNNQVLDTRGVLFDEVFDNTIEDGEAFKAVDGDIGISNVDLSVEDSSETTLEEDSKDTLQLLVLTPEEEAEIDAVTEKVVQDNIDEIISENIDNKEVSFQTIEPSDENVTNINVEEQVEDIILADIIEKEDDTVTENREEENTVNDEGTENNIEEQRQFEIEDKDNEEEVYVVLNHLDKHQKDIIIEEAQPTDQQPQDNEEEIKMAEELDEDAEIVELTNYDYLEELVEEEKLNIEEVNNNNIQKEEYVKIKEIQQDIHGEGEEIKKLERIEAIEYPTERLPNNIRDVLEDFRFPPRIREDNFSHSISISLDQEHKDDDTDKSQTESPDVVLEEISLTDYEDVNNDDNIDTFQSFLPEVPDKTLKNKLTDITKDYDTENEISNHIDLDTTQLLEDEGPRKAALLRDGKKIEVRGGLDFTNAVFDESLGKRCIVKREERDTIKKVPVLECTHKNLETCHYTYITKFQPTPEEICDENFDKQCSITFKQRSFNETVRKCNTSLKKVCDGQGTEVCQTRYESSCTTKYVEKEPGKFLAETSCEKLPLEICGAGCTVEEAPEVCHDETLATVVEVPEEVCDLNPQKTCRFITRLTPRLEPTKECTVVPRETCQLSYQNPSPAKEAIVTKWCLDESDLDDEGLEGRVDLRTVPEEKSGQSREDIVFREDTPVIGETENLPQDLQEEDNLEQYEEEEDVQATIAKRNVRLRQNKPRYQTYFI